jgi:Arc/MetJ-type ribon-helix-helix transcriptional regulator
MELKMDNTKQQDPGKKGKNQVESAISEIGDQMERLATKTAESIRKAIDKALASRNTVLTIRVNEESNKKLTMLVDTGLFRSRSESAAFLIEAGIRSQEALFNRIKDKLETIDKIREELKTIVGGTETGQT